MEYIHVHTCYSLLDSVIKPEELVPKVKELGGTALCVTEHGNLYSSIKLYELCQKHGIKYLHGVEAYICDDVNVRDKNAKYYHLVLISKNETGRLNLLKLVSESSKYKYNGKPRIDFEMLKQYKEGLIVSSACMAGEVSKSLMKGEIVSAYEIATKYKEEFGDDYYLEIQSHNAHEQQQLNRQIVSMADQLGIKYIVTTDAHFLEEEDQKYHSIFVQIGQTREVGETYNDCFLQSEEQVRERLSSLTNREIDTAISNLSEIVDKCNVQIPLSAPIMPHVPIPDEYDSEYDYLVKLCEDGKKARGIDKLPEDKRRVAENRITYELDTIKEMGFAGYFLLVRSYCNQVERRGIGRGSAGGCFVAYLLGIVNTDSIEYDLYFERFLDVGSLQLYKEGKLDKGELKIPD